MWKCGSIVICFYKKIIKSSGSSKCKYSTGLYEKCLIHKKKISDILKQY